MNIKDLVKDKTVTFSYYRAGFLHYTIDGVDFEFTVPIEDCGEASFNAQDKAIVFMRYIRKQLELIKITTNKPTTLKEVCYKCAFFDLTLSIRDKYRCHVEGHCPTYEISREEIDKLIKERQLTK